MRVAIGNTALAATLITNCFVALAKDHGIDLSTAVQDQIQTVAVTLIGLALTAFVQWAHDLMKAHKDKQIAVLSAANPVPAVQAVQPAK